MVQARAWLRSVHREQVGRVIEPRNEVIVEPTSFSERKAASLVPREARSQRSTGVEERGMRARGSPGTWEVSGFSVAKETVRAPSEKWPRPPVVVQCRTERRAHDAAVRLPEKGTDGAGEVGVFE